jgi:hypothetical protein
MGLLPVGILPWKYAPIPFGHAGKATGQSAPDGILPSAVRDRSERVEVGSNLARVDRPLHQGRSNEDRRDTVSIDECWRACLIGIQWKHRLGG